MDPKLTIRDRTTVGKAHQTAQARPQPHSAWHSQWSEGARLFKMFASPLAPGMLARSTGMTPASSYTGPDPSERAGPSKLISAIVSAPWQGSELIFARLPVGSAAQMRADRGDHEQAVRRPRDPDSVLLLPLGVDSERIVVRRADPKCPRRFKDGARQEKPQEHQKVGNKTGGNR